MTDPSNTHALWDGTRVLITGHTGFKGSWLALWLQALGADVVGLSLDPPSTPSLFRQARVDDGMISVRGDVRDVDTVRRVMETHRPEVVFHLAAQSLVRPSYQAPVETYATNVMGTVHVLDAMRQVGGARVGVVVTSDKCYANRESTLWGYRETDPMGGHDPYSSSKGCTELVVASYRRSFFDPGPTGQTRRRTALASVRAGNVIGGGDWATDRLIPDAIRAFTAGQPLHVRRPDAVRPWQHVLDPLSGYLLLAEQLWDEGTVRGGAWNFGPDADDARPVAAVVDQMIDRWGDGATATLDVGPHPHEATHLRLDCSKARSQLRWRPRLPLGRALDWTVDWYRAVGAGADARAQTLEHIHRYQTLPVHDVHQGIPSGRLPHRSRKAPG